MDPKERPWWQDWQDALPDEYVFPADDPKDRLVLKKKFDKNGVPYYSAPFDWRAYRSPKQEG